MPSLSTTLGAFGVIGFSAIVALEPAFAGAGGSCVVVSVPAPIVGAGIPALVAFAGGYWAMRKRRKP
jgi:lipopolysaccharide export LptBFGC system permease protein LptF